eukprot:GEMP01004471.1.p1 GENE.GEMP01004471.1~~GEMP01004471.1.p1  ORF type:complete len:649 (+),score=90.74 GEMP01004471.1:361-2307(+)
MQEIYCMRLMDHRYIVHLYDFYEDEKFLYCVMDQFSGTELFAKLKHYDLRESHFARYLMMMLSAVQYIGTVKVVHRDIKPENFLFKTDDPDGDLCMIDFGLSQIIEDDEYLSVCCGTVQYLSPEQIKGRYRFDVDIWAVGVITYLLLFGRFPFSGSGDAAIMHEIIHKDLVYKSSQTKKEHVNKVSCAAKDFCSLMLTKNPAQRLSPDAALQHPWIVMDHAAKKEDHVIDKNTIRMAHAVALSSRRDVDPNLQNIRDALIAEADAAVHPEPTGKRNSIMSSVAKSVRMSRVSATGAEDDRPQTRGSIITSSMGLFRGGAKETTPKSILAQSCSLHLLDDEERPTAHVRTSIIDQICKSVGLGSKSGSIVPGRNSRASYSQVVPLDSEALNTAAAQFLHERRKSRFENNRLETAAYKFRRARSVGSSELAQQVAVVRQRMRNMQRSGNYCFSVTLGDHGLDRTVGRSNSMVETSTESRARMSRQGDTIHVISAYLPDAVRCQEKTIITTMDIMDKAIKTKRASNLTQALDATEALEIRGKNVCHETLPGAGWNAPRKSAMRASTLFPNRGIAKCRVTIDTSEFNRAMRPTTHLDHVAQIFRFQELLETGISEEQEVASVPRKKHGSIESGGGNKLASSGSGNSRLATWS